MHKKVYTSTKVPVYMPRLMWYVAKAKHWEIGGVKGGLEVRSSGMRFSLHKRGISALLCDELLERVQCASFPAVRDFADLGFCPPTPIRILLLELATKNGCDQGADVRGDFKIADKVCPCQILRTRRLPSMIYIAEVSSLRFSLTRCDP